MAVGPPMPGDMDNGTAQPIQQAAAGFRIRIDIAHSDDTIQFFFWTSIGFVDVCSSKHSESTFCISYGLNAAKVEACEERLKNGQCFDSRFLFRKQVKCC